MRTKRLISPLHSILLNKFSFEFQSSTWCISQPNTLSNKILCAYAKYVLIHVCRYVQYLHDVCAVASIRALYAVILAFGCTRWPFLEFWFFFRFHKTRRTMIIILCIASNLSHVPIHLVYFSLLVDPIFAVQTIKKEDDGERNFPIVFVYKKCQCPERSRHIWRPRIDCIWWSLEREIGGPRQRKRTHEIYF